MAAKEQRRAFISYSRINKEFAEKFAGELRSSGYNIWFDLMDIPTGSRWDDEVEKALRECSIFLIILTPAAIASENVKDEIGYAVDHGKRILPILLENCDVPLRLRRFQYVDFTAKSFKEGIEGAEELLRNFIGEASVPVAVEDSPVKSPVETKVVSKPEPASAGLAQKKPVSKGLVIGGVVGLVAVIAVIAFVIAGIGLGSLSKKNISGEYAMSGTSTCGEPSYSGIAAITQQGSSYSLRWNYTDGETVTASGNFDGETLRVTYGQTPNVNQGEATYTLLPNGNLSGTWTTPPSCQGTEELTPRGQVVDSPATDAPAVQVNGSNVIRVEYQGEDYVGEFVLTGDKTWVERNKTNNTENSFSETNRDEWSVYLYDSARNINIKIDLYQKQIFVDTNDGNGEFFLYAILNAESQ